MMRLQEQLDSIKQKSADRMTPEIVDAIQAGSAELKSRNLFDKMPKVGDTAPDVALTDDKGMVHQLRELTSAGPLVIHFYRGKW
jgi:hypothetical protein